MTTVEDKTMSRENARRLMKDIKSLMKEPLQSENIYYKHDESNMLKGYAMIIGPKDSLYENGIYLFDFDFPVNYPYSPPKLSYKTNDGYVRFHPNFYKNGKVCISILNTWPGDPWTSCQTIRSILMTLVMLFDNKPLLHEPGIKETHFDFEKYNKIVTYKNIEIAFYEVCRRILKNNVQIHTSMIFKDEIIKHYHEKKEYMKKKVMDKLSENNEKELIQTVVYGMRFEIDYNMLDIISCMNMDMADMATGPK